MWNSQQAPAHQYAAWGSPSSAVRTFSSALKHKACSLIISALFYTHMQVGVCAPLPSSTHTHTTQSLSFSQIHHTHTHTCTHVRAFMHAGMHTHTHTHTRTLTRILLVSATLVDLKAELDNDVKDDPHTNHYHHTHHHHSLFLPL